MDNASNLYVADFNNDAIRKLTPTGTNWVVSTLAGLPATTGSADGTNGNARFYAPHDIAIDSATNLYISDHDNNTVRKMTQAGTNWVVTTLGGLAPIAGTNDGTGSTARFNGLAGLGLDSLGSLYVADALNNTIRKGYPPVPPVIVSQPQNASVPYGTSCQSQCHRQRAPPRLSVAIRRLLTFPGASSNS